MEGGRRLVRCAVYTRKSSEHGLEQDFNSLEAQREAAEAYILSQRHEGWRLVKTRYDDGGLSGGTLERPGLQRLLADIEARRIDVVVVYKVDRLTRSLADFAKLVESFERHGVSFVSVTQQFNTTSSMGRLTLNVLLSFAQFEHEIAGERIRDKFAASRKKGMWMGGHPPLGYDIQDRKLVVNAREADSVRRIFDLFCQLGCVAKLKATLDVAGMRSKARVSDTGRRYGGKPHSRGSLYHILKNRIYRGEVNHKGTWYPGDHAPIVSAELWTRAQEILAGHRMDRVHEGRQAAPSLLKGLLFDDAGNRMSPSHARRHGRRYLYYVSQALLQHRPQAAGSVARLPAHEIEEAVMDRIARLLSDPAKLIARLGISDSQTREAVKAGEYRHDASAGRPRPRGRGLASLLIAIRDSVRSLSYPDRGDDLLGLDVDHRHGVGDDVRHEHPVAARARDHAMRALARRERRDHFAGRDIDHRDGLRWLGLRALVGDVHEFSIGRGEDLDRVTSHRNLPEHLARLRVEHGDRVFAIQGDVDAPAIRREADLDGRRADGHARGLPAGRHVDDGDSAILDVGDVELAAVRAQAQAVGIAPRGDLPHHLTPSKVDHIDRIVGRVAHIGGACGSIDHNMGGMRADRNIGGRSARDVPRVIDEQPSGLGLAVPSAVCGHHPHGEQRPPIVRDLHVVRRDRHFESCGFFSGKLDDADRVAFLVGGIDPTGGGQRRSGGDRRACDQRQCRRAQARNPC